MAYRADIEIAVRGAQDLKRLQNEISTASKLVNQLNQYIETFGGPSIVRSVRNLKDVVSEAATAFNKAALGTDEATIAAKKYIEATTELNAGLRERALLLKQVAEEERKARLSRAGIRETTQYAGPIGPGPASPVGSLVGQKSPVEERIKRTLAARQDELDLQQALLRLEEKSAAAANVELQARGQIAALTAKSVNAAKFAATQNRAPLALPAFTERGLQVLDNTYRLNESNLRIEQALNGERARGVRFLEKQSAEEARQVQLGILGQRSNRLPGIGAVTGGVFPTEGPIPLSQFGQGSRSAAGAALRGRAGGAVGNALIGGAFPLLFGQGGGAALGGAIGGLAGGAFGGVGGFAGSLVGTLIGDIASQGQAVQQLAEDIGFSAEQTNRLSAAFKVANTDVEKFTAVIQNIRGLGLEIEDQAKAIQLVTRLTELYGGSFEKTGTAITSALEGGKVTQAILNQLTSQGIDIQQALADKYKVNKDAILAMAKDGKISVQDLIDTLVKLGNDTDIVTKKQQNVFEAAYERISSAAAEAANAATSSFSQTGGELQQVASTIQSAFTSMFDELVRGTSEFILGLGEIARIAGSALDGVIAKFLDIQYGILNAANNLPVLDSGIIEFAKNALAVLNPVGALIDKIRGAGKNRPQQFGPEPPPVSRAQIESFRVPSQMPPSGGGKKTSSKAADDAEARIQAEIQALAIETNANKKQLEIKQKINAAEIAGDEQLAVRLQGEERTQQILADLQKSLIGITDERKRQAVIAKAASEIDVQQAATAGELAKIDNQRVKAIEDVLSGLDKELVALDATTDVKQQALKFLEIENELKKQGITLTNADEEAIRKKIAEIQKATKAQEEATAKLQMEKELFDGISSAIASTFSGAIDAAVQGTENLGDALTDLGTDLLATIGNMLIMYGIAQALGALGGGDSVGIFSSLAKAFGYKGAKDGAYWPGGFKAFAEGGLVTSPTMGLIGEGGEPEYVIPASKMSAAMSRYASGARGSSVIPATGDNMTGDGGNSANTFTLETVVINNVEYATVDQVRSMGQRAASQGAQGGFSKSMRTLQNSRSQRSRLGLR